MALARALAIEPRVLLLDEPFGALDAKVRKELRRWLREIHDRTGHTTVFVTHDQEEALELADRVVVMSQGRIEQVGTPDEVYDTPNSPFVFSFIGELSALAGARRGGRILDRRPRHRPPGAGRAAGRGAVLFFRPHDVELLDGRAAASPARSRPAAASAAPAVSSSRWRRRPRVELEIPTSHPAAEKTRIAFRPKKWKLFPDG